MLRGAKAAAKRAAHEEAASKAKADNLTKVSDTYQLVYSDIQNKSKVLHQMHPHAYAFDYSTQTAHPDHGSNGNLLRPFSFYMSTPW